MSETNASPFDPKQRQDGHIGTFTWGPACHHTDIRLPEPHSSKTIATQWPGQQKPKRYLACIWNISTLPLKKLALKSRRGLREAGAPTFCYEFRCIIILEFQTRLFMPWAPPTDENRRDEGTRPFQERLLASRTRPLRENPTPLVGAGSKGK